MKYRIEWTDLSTNYSSHGKWFDTKQFLEENVKYLNKMYVNQIIHIVVTKQ